MGGCRTKGRACNACATLQRGLSRTHPHNTGNAGALHTLPHPDVHIQAMAVLLARIQRAPQHALRALLDDVFRYSRVRELRPAAVAVLAHLRPVPRQNLSALADHADVFLELPLSVQRQVRPQFLCSGLRWQRLVLWQRLALWQRLVLW